MSVEVMSGGGSANLLSTSILPSSLPYTASPYGGYDGFSSLTVRKPSSLIPDNIKSGISLFGVTGTAEVFAGKVLTNPILENVNGYIGFNTGLTSDVKLYAFKLSAFSLASTNTISFAEICPDFVDGIWSTLTINTDISGRALYTTPVLIGNDMQTSSVIDIFFYSKYGQVYAIFDGVKSGINIPTRIDSVCLMYSI